MARSVKVGRHTFYSEKKEKKKKGLMEAIVYCGCFRRKVIGKQSSQIPNLQYVNYPQHYSYFDLKK